MAKTYTLNKNKWRSTVRDGKHFGIVHWKSALQAGSAIRVVRRMQCA